MKIFLLFYDYDNGSREEWNTFYTPCESFVDAVTRAKRKAYLKKLNKNLEFHELDLETIDLVNVQSAPVAEAYTDDDNDEEDDE